MYQQNMPPYVQVPVPVVMPHNSGAAVISLISGILSWIILPGVGAVVAIISGHVAKGEIRRGMGLVTGEGMATWGLILGYLNIALSLCLTCVGILVTLGVITLPFAVPFLTPSSSSY